MPVTIYTTSNCAACEATKKWLDRRGVPYAVEWLKESVEAMELAKAHGWTAAPVVVAGSVSWSGFRPDLIDKIDDGASNSIDIADDADRIL